MRIRARSDGYRERRQAPAEAGSAGREPEPARGASDVFRRQAEQFEMLGAPAYAQLAGRLALDTRPVEPILGGDESWDAALRLFAAVHYLVLSGAAPDALSGNWDDFTAVLGVHTEALRRHVREHGVQTNEVQRCVALLPAVLTIARETGLPVELLELGPSAGLNLLLDRHRYHYVNGPWGPPRAALELVAQERGGRVPADLLGERLDVRRRRGIDLAPVDATTDEGYLLLRSFLWPGLEDRVARLDAAVATLRAEPEPPELIRGNYVDVLAEVLADRPADAVTVVLQTASTGYLDADAAAALRGALDAAADDGRLLAWVSTRRHDEREGSSDDFYELELRIWPGPPRLAAHVDFHGNWLDWRLS
jgi:hypothetical protein